MADEFKIKKLQINQEDFSKVVDDVVNEFTRRAVKNNERLSQGFMDAPCMEAAVSLGAENLANAPAYKVNVPGYFYLQHHKGDWTSAGTGGVLIADRPTNLTSATTRMVYMSISDGQIGHANNMFAILPGTKTYAYIVRNTRLTDADVHREWLFVPTVFAASLNILPESYVSKVGVPSESQMDLTGQLNPLSPSLSGIAFAGDWKTQFKSVCGWNVLNEASTEFIGTGATDFRTERTNWIDGLGARRSDYGY